MSPIVCIRLTLRGFINIIVRLHVAYNLLLTAWHHNICPNFAGPQDFFDAAVAAHGW